MTLGDTLHVVKIAQFVNGLQISNAPLYHVYSVLLSFRLDQINLRHCIIL